MGNATGTTCDEVHHLQESKPVPRHRDIRDRRHVRGNVHMCRVAEPYAIATQDRMAAATAAIQVIHALEDAAIDGA